MINVNDFAFGTGISFRNFIELMPHGESGKMHYAINEDNELVVRTVDSIDETTVMVRKIFFHGYGKVTMYKKIHDAHDPNNDTSKQKTFYGLCKKEFIKEWTAFFGTPPLTDDFDLQPSKFFSNPWEKMRTTGDSENSSNS